MRLGWMEVLEPELVQMLLKIQKVMKDEGLDLIQSHNRHWFRASMAPQDIFFHPEFFQYELLMPEPDRWELNLHVAATDSPLGNIPESRFVCQLGSEKRYQYLKSVEEGHPSLDIFSEPKRELRKVIDPLTQPWGLRKLVREVKGKLQMVSNPRC